MVDPRRTPALGLPLLGEGLTPDRLGDDPVDVLVKGESETTPSLLVEGVRVVGTSMSGGKVTGVNLQTNPSQVALLNQAQADQMRFVLHRHQPSPFAVLWSSPPVDVGDFLTVGHSLCGLFCAWVGSAVARYFYTTRDPAP